ncbi:MAG: type II toxin-antitoxin system RelE/ParE family toxin [Acidobacteriota bacterium]
MTGAARFHPRARRDLIEQATYLAENASLEVADRFLESAERTVAQLVDTPRMGRVWEGARPETQRGLRVWRVSDFPKVLIFYRLESDAIVVVRILHSAQDLPAHLNVDAREPRD